MSTGIIKSAIGAGVVAVLAGSYLSSHADNQGQGFDWARLLPSGLFQTAAPVAPGEPRIITRTITQTVVRDAPAAAAPTPAELPNAPAPSPGYMREEFQPDRFGQFHASVDIDGVTIPMLVDTGASVVALSYETARRLGVVPAPDKFKIPMQTANGVSYAAPVTLRKIWLGSLSASDVAAVVAQRGVGSPDLLGMSFLRKLGGFQIEAGNLILRQ